MVGTHASRLQQTFPASKRNLSTLKFQLTIKVCQVSFRAIALIASGTHAFRPLNIMFQSFILAGGKSSRMKCDKAFLKLGDRTLLEHSISTLEKIDSNKISIVVAHQTDKFQNYSVITDIYKNCGTLGGVHSALANCNEKDALIIACDYPFISSELLKFLLNIAKNNDSDCVAPIQKDGIIQPLCAIYKTSKCLETLSAILEKSNKTPSARDFLKRIDTKLIEFEEFEHLQNSDNFFFNVNTPEDFEEAIKIYNDR